MKMGMGSGHRYPLCDVFVRVCFACVYLVVICLLVVYTRRLGFDVERWQMSEGVARIEAGNGNRNINGDGYTN